MSDHPCAPAMHMAAAPTLQAERSPMRLGLRDLGHPHRGHAGRRPALHLQAWRLRGGRPCPPSRAPDLLRAAYPLRPRNAAGAPHALRAPYPARAANREHPSGRQRGADPLQHLSGLSRNRLRRARPAVALRPPLLHGFDRVHPYVRARSTTIEWPTGVEEHRGEVRTHLSRARARFRQDAVGSIWRRCRSVGSVGTRRPDAMKDP